MKHTIDINDLADFSYSSDLAGSYSKNSHKILKMVVRRLAGTPEVSFEVLENRELKFSSSSLKGAIAIYNDLN